ncbi:unnamed protein product [Symbiodinium pilosum]|uniref:Uncharacterized protein n=1 Tax=Symbiodinium pilosum TaxID=2952 RepID=A0A812SP66_SYMPI|nr:unnamed protein product [Symbiodinium pilosum]
MNAILAVAAAVASTAVRLDIANQPAAARCPGDVILAVYGRSDYNENIDDSTWLDDDMVNMIGGYPIFQQHTAQGKRFQYHVGCNFQTQRPALYYEEVTETGQGVPNTFAVIPLKDTEPLRVYVGQYGPEVVEFAWTTLLMDVLVDGVVTLQDGHGFKPPPPPSMRTTTTSPRTVQPSSAWRRAKMLLSGENSKTSETTESKSTGKEEDDEASEASDADSDIVDIKTGDGVQRAIQLDPARHSKESEAHNADVQTELTQKLPDLNFCQRTVTLELVGTMERNAQQQSVLKAVHTKVKVPPEYYTKLGGLRIFAKKAQGRVDKIYYLRCDFTNGQPLLIMRQGGDVEVRRFNFKWWRTSSVQESIGEHLDLLADPVSVPYPVVKGYVTVTPD